MEHLKKELEFIDTKENRTEDCVHYRDCLDSASRQHLTSFSCLGCEKFELNPDFRYDPMVRGYPPIWPSEMKRRDAPNQQERDKMTAIMEKNGYNRFDPNRNNKDVKR